MNLIEGLLNEIERCSKLVEEYKSIGPAGTFGAMIIQSDIDAAKRAMAEDDVIAEMRLYKRLKDAE